MKIDALPVYANNAAALAGGLTAGDLYRTNGDPDPVCVVHNKQVINENDNFPHNLCVFNMHKLRSIRYNQDSEEKNGYAL